MCKIYSYILRVDDGAAPNPFWDVCTLTICKPAIRRNAKIGDWIIGTGSKNAQLSDNNKYDFSDSIVYAMKVSDIKSLKEYDAYCQSSLKNKIPNWGSKDWRKRAGDCIYKYSDSDMPQLRKSVHGEDYTKRDLSGYNALLSSTFYYFGEEARPLPSELQSLIKKNQGHKKIENQELIKGFENWISQFESNKIYAKPQMSWRFNKSTLEEEHNLCLERHGDILEDELEESLC